MLWPVFRWLLIAFLGFNALVLVGIIVYAYVTRVPAT